MSFTAHESALAELAQASKAFSQEDNQESQLFAEPLSFQSTIDAELRGAGEAFPEDVDIDLSDAPALEIHDVKKEKEPEWQDPLITIGTNKLYNLHAGEEPQDCEYVIIYLFL
jgi:hypothetical protein